MSRHHSKTPSCSETTTIASRASSCSTKSVGSRRLLNENNNHSQQEGDEEECCADTDENDSIGTTSTGSNPDCPSTAITEASTGGASTSFHEMETSSSPGPAAPDLEDDSSGNDHQHDEDFDDDDDEEVRRNSLHCSCCREPSSSSCSPPTDAVSDDEMMGRDVSVSYCHAQHDENDGEETQQQQQQQRLDCCEENNPYEKERARQEDVATVPLGAPDDFRRDARTSDLWGEKERIVLQQSRRYEEERISKVRGGADSRTRVDNNTVLLGSAVLLAVPASFPDACVPTSTRTSTSHFQPLNHNNNISRGSSTNYNVVGPFGGNATSSGPDDSLALSLPEVAYTSSSGVWSSKRLQSSSHPGTVMQRCQSAGAAMTTATADMDDEGIPPPPALLPGRHYSQPGAFRVSVQSHTAGPQQQQQQQAPPDASQERSHPDLPQGPQNPQGPEHRHPNVENPSNAPRDSAASEDGVDPTLLIPQGSDYVVEAHLVHDEDSRSRRSGSRRRGSTGTSRRRRRSDERRHHPDGNSSVESMEEGTSASLHSASSSNSTQSYSLNDADVEMPPELAPATSDLQLSAGSRRSQQQQQVHPTPLSSIAQQPHPESSTAATATPIMATAKPLTWKSFWCSPRVLAVLLTILLMLLGAMGGIVYAVTRVNQTKEKDFIERLEHSTRAPVVVVDSNGNSLGNNNVSAVRNNSSEATSIKSPTPAPSSLSDSTRAAQRLERMLPKSTINAINYNDTYTPQARAYAWLRDDIHNPDFETYSDARLLQRFALATLYFATDGDSWFKNDKWLSIAHECDWYYDPTYFIPCAGDNLTSIALIYNDLVGSIPDEIGLLTGLVSLDLYQNQLRGTIPDRMMNMTSLENLDLYDNFLMGNIPTLLNKLTRLDYLGLAINAMHGTISSEIGELTLLQVLYFDEMHLNGTLPTEIGRLTRLKELGLSNNNLTGTVPSYYKRWVNIADLMLGSNHLNGTIDGSFWQAWAKAEYVDFGGNKLTGTIATEIGLLHHALSVDLGRNLFSGPLPTELGVLLKADALYFDGNMLTGTIPTELGKLTNLKNLLLDDNLFHGSLPTEVCDLIRNNTLHVVVDCDLVECDCGCDCGMNRGNSNNNNSGSRYK